MRWLISAAAPLLLIFSNSIYVLIAQSRDGSAINEVQRPAKSEAASIDFREFFEAGASELKPTEKLLSLNGRRARMVGFMAQMEKAPIGAFYLCPRPVYADESGGGTAELPVGSVLVIVRSAKGKEVPYIAHAIEVTGILEVGARAEEDGTVSAIRLILDAPEKPANSAAPSSSATKQKNKPKAIFKHQRRK